MIQLERLKNTVLKKPFLKVRYSRAALINHISYLGKTLVVDISKLFYFSPGCQDEGGLLSGLMNYADTINIV